MHVYTYVRTYIHTSAPSEHTKVMRSWEGGPPVWQGLPPMYLNSRPSMKSEKGAKPLSTSPSEMAALLLYQHAAVPKGHLLRLLSEVRLTGPQREMTRLEVPSTRWRSTLVFDSASVRRSYLSSPAVHSILFGRQANLGRGQTSQVSCDLTGVCNNNSCSHHFTVIFKPSPVLYIALHGHSCV